MTWDGEAEEYITENAVLQFVFRPVMDKLLNNKGLFLDSCGCKKIAWFSQLFEAATVESEVIVLSIEVAGCGLPEAIDVSTVIIFFLIGKYHQSQLS